MFKKIFLLAMTSVILQISCSDNFYELMEHEERYHLAVEATLDPTSGSSINARDTITITFSKAMNIDTLKLAGDLSSGTSEWTTATNADDTLTLSPNQAWVVGTGKTLRVDCESSEGIVMDTLDAVYEVTYSITGSPDITTGSAITGTESIVITFDEPMNTTSLVIAGSFINNDSANVTATWSTTSETNDTVTLTPANTIWPSAGADLTLTINGNSAYGPAMDEISLTYTVEYVVYVSSVSNTTNPGSPTNSGTKTAPLSTIQGGIDYADSIYTTASVRVAPVTGGYTKDYRTDGNPVISMKNGISVYGGYSEDFNTRDTATNETIIKDTSASLGLSNNPNRAVECGSGFTVNTFLDGFTITMGNGDHNAAIYCENTENFLTIQNNKISGRTSSGDAGANAYGIYNDSASVVIKNNTIQPGWNSNNGSILDYSYGIYNLSSSTTIENNEIYGGYGGDETYGIFCEGNSTPIIKNNTKLECGEGSAKYGIYLLNCTPYIENNVFSANSSVFFIFEATNNNNSDPLSFNNNLYNYSSSSFYYETQGSNSITTINWNTDTISINGGTINKTLSALGNTY